MSLIHRRWSGTGDQRELNARPSFEVRTHLTVKYQRHKHDVSRAKITVCRPDSVPVPSPMAVMVVAGVVIAVVVVILRGMAIVEAVMMVAGSVVGHGLDDFDCGRGDRRGAC
jgi:hypothetical protein